ncbi:hypothetical protein MNB_SM-7-1124 [hydrothermal vent metagenome]|uniref:DUF4412 domain-containing protein n=1 Tax=hydrothermal vent metagenome TaxID=652676 RepID=A0A1W1BAX7_9ZZZZ
MLKLLLILMGLYFVSLQASTKTFKRYLVKDGSIVYKITGSGNIMGATQKIYGSRSIVFDHYGYNEIQEEKSTQEINVFGQKQIQKTHRLTLLQGTTLKSVDFNNKKIYVITPPGMKQMIAASKQNIPQRGEKMLKQMGGKKVGDDKVLGYKCNIWKLPMATECIYKGVPLWIKANIMGIEQKEVAIKAKFNTGSYADPSKLPHYPISKASTKNSDNVSSMKNISDEDIDALNNMFEQKVNETSSDNEIKQAMLPSTKAEIRREQKQLLKDRRCIQKASTLAAFKRCVPDDEEALPTKWNHKEKQKILKEIDESLASMDCMLQAKTTAQMKQCEQN